MITAGLSMSTDHFLKGSYPLIRLFGDITTAMLSIIILLRVLGKKIMKGHHGDYLRAHVPLPPLLQRWIGL